MVLKPESRSGIDQSGDKGADASQIFDYLGSGASGPAPVRKVISGAYQDVTDIDALKDAVIDSEDYDSGLFIIDYLKGDGTDLRARLMYGDSEDRAELLNQEDAEDSSVAGVIDHPVIEHKFATGVASRKCRIFVKRLEKNMKLQIKDSNAGATTAAVAISFRGQRREK